MLALRCMCDLFHHQDSHSTEEKSLTYWTLGVNIVDKATFVKYLLNNACKTFLPRS